MDNALKITDVYDLEEQDGQFKRLLTARNKCKKAFSTKYPEGFFDPNYVKDLRITLAGAHRQWIADLNKQKFADMLFQGKHAEIAARAIAIESATNLLNQKEKAQLIQATANGSGAQIFASGLFEYLYSNGSEEERFENFSRVCAKLTPPSGNSGDLLTWQIVTVFGAIAQPRRHIFVRPIITRQAAMKYGFPFAYKPEPCWNSYSSMLDFAACLRADLSDLKPRDLLDIHLFIGSLGAEA